MSMKGSDANGQRRPQNATLRLLPNANPLSGCNGATFEAHSPNQRKYYRNVVEGRRGGD